MPLVSVFVNTACTQATLWPWPRPNRPGGKSAPQPLVLPSSCDAAICV